MIFKKKGYLDFVLRHFADNFYYYYYYFYVMEDWMKEVC